MGTHSMAQVCELQDHHLRSHRVGESGSQRLRNGRQAEWGCSRPFCPTGLDRCQAEAGTGDSGLNGGSQPVLSYPTSPSIRDSGPLRVQQCVSWLQILNWYH